MYDGSGSGVRSPRCGKRPRLCGAGQLRAVDVTGAWWDGYIELPGRYQAIRIERWRDNLKCGNQSTEITCAVTSLPPARTAAGRLNSRLREHWHIENANHDVRDLTDDEDRCRARVTNLPQNLAALTNIAISIIRLQGRFEYIAQFNR